MHQLFLDDKMVLLDFSGSGRRIDSLLPTTIDVYHILFVFCSFAISPLLYILISFIDILCEPLLDLVDRLEIFIGSVDA
jgi:hypothetical protein